MGSGDTAYFNHIQRVETYEYCFGGVAGGLLPPCTPRFRKGVPMTLPCVPPTQLVLEIPAAIQEESWQQSQLCSTPQGCWTAYLNQMCLKTLLPWLQEEIPEAAIWLNGGAIASGWDVVNGSAITIATQRLVLIPDKSLEADELRVPQEWIDTPRWAGDYYLAVQVNPEGDWLRVWGYTTHEQLKTQGHYDADDRTYCLNAT